QAVVTESCTITSDSNAQSIAAPSENVCAQCLSATVPSAMISPDDLLPCPNDYTIKCSHCQPSLNNAANNYHHVKTTGTTSYPIHLATVCNKCQSNFTQGLFCPMCLKTYSEDGQENDDDKYMVCCDICDRWIHARCDDVLTPEKYQELADIPDAKYTCPLCEGRIRPLEGNKVQQNALSGNPSAKPVAMIP
ncbi:10335_t:CDS:2, partial [Racocetra fulgida]